MRRPQLILLSLLGTLTAVSSILIMHAYAATSLAPIRFDTFSGSYYLSRDSRGLSLLTSEEVIVADFPPASGYYGITRELPKKFQNHSVDLKVLGIEDAAGNILPYKTTNTANSNLLITAGDPAITLTGIQTTRLRYQARGVISLGKKSDELLFNANGRGWNQPFNRVDVVMHIPSSFRASLTSSSCYTSLNQVNRQNCQLTITSNNQETIITARAKQVAAHQALLLKLDFRPATFTNNHASYAKYVVLIVGTLVSGLIGFSVLNLLRAKSRVV